MDLHTLLHGTNVRTLAVWRKRGDAIARDREEVHPPATLPRRRFVPVNKEPEDGKQP